MAKVGNQGDGGGRPARVFTPEEVTELKALAAVLNKAQLADYFGISEKTLREVESRQPEVSTAYKNGRAKSIAGVANNLINQAINGNTSAAIFYLKTQAGWKETSVQELNGDVRLTAIERVIVKAKD